MGGAIVINFSQVSPLSGVAVPARQATKSLLSGVAVPARQATKSLLSGVAVPARQSTKDGNGSSLCRLVGRYAISAERA